MSAHWRLALRCALWVAVLAVLAAAAVFYFYDKTHAGALLYGAGVGLVSFVSMAFTVSWLTGRSMLWRGMGVVSFVVRYGFVVGALGIPAYLGLWPGVAMIGGFGGVYLAENLIFLPVIALGMLSKRSEKRGAGNPVVGSVERRAEV